ncbi:MAG: hypothetical protein ABJE80_21175 [Reichenbachiella sp.]|uniref:hypothetical protein n=1 Tax=Reichenbachiella sp. TaxID=2184521 RepID=UPI0032639D09
MINPLKIILLASLLSCSPNRGDNDIQVINMGIHAAHDKVVSLLSKEDDLYLIAEERLSDFKSIRSIFYSSDDTGATWKKINTLQGKSRITFENENNLYVINEIFTENSFNNQRSFLYKLNLVDNEVHKIKEFNGYIHSAFFVGSNGCAFVRKSGKASDYFLYQTNDDGISWISSQISRPILKSKMKGSKIYFSTHKDDLLKNDIFLINLADNKIDPIGLEMNVADFEVRSDNDILLLGKSNKGIELSRYKDNLVTSLKVFPAKDSFFPKMLIGKGDFLVVLIGEVKSMSTTNQIFISKDMGKTWEEKNLPINNYNEPLVIYKENKVLNYNGKAKITLIH